MATELKIVDLRVTPGDSAYLVYDNTVTILYDSGFGFTGERLAKKINLILGNRTLDYIFLTHSHYDHCLGIPYVLKIYPRAKVVGGVHTAEVFKRPHAIEKMKELDLAHAKHYGIENYEFLGNELKLDLIVRDGDVITAGAHKFKVLEVSGHTKCSVAFYEEESRFLLSSETLGIYYGQGVLPITLTGFNQAILSIRKIKQLPLERILIPHLGEIRSLEMERYLEIVEGEFIKARDFMLDELKNGTDKAEIVNKFSSKFAGGPIEEIYPPDASFLNASIMLNLIEKEYMTI